MLRLWDNSTEEMTSSPYYFQSFIGHSYEIEQVFFNPQDNTQCISVGGKDGIFLWKFHGDTSPVALPEPSELKTEEQIETHEDVDVKGEDQIEAVEEEGNQVEEEVVEQSESDAPESIKDIGTEFRLQATPTFDTEGVLQISQLSRSLMEKRASLNRSVLSYMSETEEFEDVDVPHNQCLEAEHIIGYNGEEAVKNLFWNETEGWNLFTTKNKLIIEHLSTKTHTIVYTGKSNISTFALSEDKKLLAVGHGSPNTCESAQIILFTVSSQGVIDEINRLSCHAKGISLLAFSHNSKQLVSVGTEDEPLIVVWDVEQGSVVTSTINTGSVNDISILSNPDELIFATVGNQSFKMWKIDPETMEDLLYLDIPLVDNESNLTAIASINSMPAPYNCSILLLGDSEGGIVVYTPESNEFIAKINKVVQGSIGLIQVYEESIMVSDDQGSWTYSKIIPEQALFSQEGVVISNKAPVVAASFDKKGVEGQIGLMNGEIKYINWNDNLNIRIASNHISENVTFLPGSSKTMSSPLFVTGGQDGFLKLWASQTCDLLIEFKLSNEAITSIVNHPRERILLVATKDSRVHFFDTRQLKGLGFVSLSNGYATSADFHIQGGSFVLGTSTGNIVQGTVADWKNLSTVRLATVDSSIETEVTSIEFSKLEQEEKVIVGSADGFVRIFTLENGVATLAEQFDIFKDPHGLNDSEPVENLYQGKTHKITARFSTWDKDAYLCIADSLQYVFILNSSQPDQATRLNLTLFPTSLEMNSGSDGLWAVGTKNGTIVYRHHGCEEAKRFNGEQSVKAIGFGNTGDRMVVLGTSETMMFKF